MDEEEPITITTWEPIEYGFEFHVKFHNRVSIYSDFYNVLMDFCFFLIGTWLTLHCRTIV